MQKSSQLSWADLAEATEQWAAEHHCVLEFSLYCYRPFRTSPRLVWTVVAFARYKRGKPEEMIGVSTAQLGTNAGSRTMPGTILRAMMGACENLEKRRGDKAYDRDTPVPRLPGF